MNLKLTILCENSVERILPGGLIGEHGFACLLRSDRGAYLFDTGSGLGLAHNCEQLGIDLTDLKGVILSHGHCDHSGGLPVALQQHTVLPVFAHPDVFHRRYSGRPGQQRQIGLPWSRAELESLGADLQLSRKPQQLSEQIFLSGEIPRRWPTGSLDRQLFVKDPQGHDRPDPLSDDLSVFIRTDQGLVILLGCAHAGLQNILAHAQEVTGEKKIHLLLGGTHLKGNNQEQIAATIAMLESYHVERIGASHCTGLGPAVQLANHFGERFFHASVGAMVEI